MKLLIGLAFSLLSATLYAQSVEGPALVSALEKGGYVIVMRHASSPRQEPDAATANPDNTTRERQLDDVGRTTATDFGKALRQLHIPIGQVYSSPTYRAQETIRLASLPTPTLAPELGENGQSMQATTDSQADWLRKKVTEFPQGTNTILVTHFPNITSAFPQWSSGIGDGEALIFGPDGKGGAIMIARVKIDDWPKFVRTSK
jgi:phosphohistidine phosphatase SixA